MGMIRYLFLDEDSDDGDNGENNEKIIRLSLNKEAKV